MITLLTLCFAMSRPISAYATNLSSITPATDISRLEEIGKIYEIKSSQEDEFLGQNNNQAKERVNDEITKDSRNLSKAKGYTISSVNTYTLNDYSPLTEYVVKSTFNVMNGSKKVGSGSCSGRPYNSYVDLQRVSLW